MTPRLLEQYRQHVAGALTEQFGYKNRMAIPRLEKIVVSMGIGQASTDQAHLDTALQQLADITGQRPVVTLAKVSISNFKLRQGMKVGLKVTLRRERMWEFLDRLVSLAIPRVKDFRGLNPSAFDGRGNYNMGLVEQSVFPEIDPAKLTFTQGMNIAMSTSAKTDEEARALLSLLGLPFRTEEQ